MIAAMKVGQGPSMDGELLESEWALASAADDLLQHEPREGAPPSERTEIRIIYTTTDLYIGVWCYDSAPQGIRATERGRDASLEGDDRFLLVIDTAHGHRDAYFFQTNPLGARWDALLTDEGKLENLEWDGRWEVAARVHPWGWGAEIQIPFKTLRIPAMEELLWGIDFGRDLRRQNERVVWSNYQQDFDFQEVSQAGHVTGLQNIDRALNLRVKPYLTTEALGLRSEGSSVTTRDADVGIEDLRYTLTSRVNVNLAVNPDFAQADVDAVQVNLTRFPLFFREKREFFLEDAGLFEFGTGGGNEFFGRPDLKLLHTRRIGLTSSRESIPLLLGGRITSQTPGWTLGVMNVQEREHQQIPGRNFGAYRMKRNLFARSYVGAMATYVQQRGAGHSGTVGIDANFLFLENFRLQGFVVRSESDERSGDGWAAVPFWLEWDSDRLGFEVQQLIVESTFRADAGFVGRTDIRRHVVNTRYSPRPRVSWVRQLEFGANLEYLTDFEWSLQTRDQSIGFRMDLESGDAAEVEYTWNLERLNEPFRVGGQILVPPGVYRNSGFSFQFHPYRGRPVAGFFRVARGDFWGGERTSVEIQPGVRWADWFLTDFGYEVEQVSVPGGSFISHIVDTRIDVNVTNEWLWSTTLQYNDLDDEWGVHFRLNYIYRTGDDVFVVVRRARTMEDRSWSVLVKLTHTLDF